MAVLAWIAQILLFFISWRIFQWIAGTLRKSSGGTSVWVTLAVNLVVAIVYVFSLYSIHSVWWGIGIIGAGVGVLVAQVLSRPSDE